MQRVEFSRMKTIADKVSAVMPLAADLVSTGRGERGKKEDEEEEDEEEKEERKMNGKSPLWHGRVRTWVCTSPR